MLELFSRIEIEIEIFSKVQSFSHPTYRDEGLHFPTGPARIRPPPSVLAFTVSQTLFYPPGGKPDETRDPTDALVYFRPCLYTILTIAVAAAAAAACSTADEVSEMFPFSGNVVVAASEHPTWARVRARAGECVRGISDARQIDADTAPDAREGRAGKMLGNRAN